MTIPVAIQTIIKQKGKNIFKDIFLFAKLLRQLAPMPEASQKEVNLIRIGVDKAFLNLFIDDSLSLESRLEKIKRKLENLGLSYESIIYLIETFGIPLGYEETINKFKSKNIVVQIATTNTLSQKFEVEDVVLDYSTLKRLGYKSKYDITEIEIPPSFSTYSGVIYKITAIGNDVFSHLTSLTRVIVPNTVENIHSNAFKGCTSLKEVVLPDTIKFIGESAFENCNSLESIEVPTCIDRIATRLFCNCKSLKNIIIPKNVKNIGESAFENCASFTEIVIPDGVKTISKKTFFGCESLKNISIPDSVIDIEDMAFANCYSLNNLVIPQTVAQFGCNLFGNCNNLKMVTVPIQFLKENLTQNLFDDANNGEPTSKDLKNDDSVDSNPSSKKLGKAVSQEDLIKINQTLYQNYCQNKMSKSELISQFRNEMINIMSGVDPYLSKNN